MTLRIETEALAARGMDTPAPPIMTACVSPY